MFSSNVTLQRGHLYNFSAENTIAYPIIELHFGHLIPMYNRMFHTPNIANALYNIALKIMEGQYFSINANTIKAAKPIATKVKYKFFRLFILSLSLIVSPDVGLTLRLSFGPPEVDPDFPTYRPSWCRQDFFHHKGEITDCPLAVTDKCRAVHGCEGSRLESSELLQKSFCLRCKG